LKTISIVSSCFNEEENVGLMVERVQAVMAKHPEYQYEQIFIDNDSSDQTVNRLRAIASRDPHVKVILNSRNFGYIRSHFYAILQARGDAVVVIASDLQEPPEMIHEYIRKWEEGFKIVAGIKTASEENPFIYFLRGVYYRLIRMSSSVDLLEQFTGFGLYDKKIIDILRSLREPYPYFRGLVSDIGFPVAKIEYTQAARVHGKTSSNFFMLFDVAMLGFTNYTKIPLRLATILGFFAASVSLLVGLCYLVAKLIFWNSFTAGMAPVLIGLCFLGSVQLLFLGVIGEYVGSIFTYVQNRPLVFEKERVNFENDTGVEPAKGAQS
jgi:glycosyltransferase involved in cell wall biosynthesis